MKKSNAEAFLFAWNPSSYDWSNIDDCIQNLDKQYEKTWGEQALRWSTGTRKTLPEGSRFYVIRLAIPPKGIVGIGRTISEPYNDEHWITPNKTATYVKIKYELLSKEPLIPLEQLHALPGTSFRWEIQGSGVKIPSDLARTLDWALYNFSGTFSEHVETSGSYTEGAVKKVTVNAYERDVDARRACIEHYGVKCQICCFDFEKFYGERGRGYIHVHHLVALSEIGKEYQVDPVNDLLPVCPNCHAMLHNKPEITVEKLKQLVMKC